MNEGADPARGGRLSRRDFVRGRFWRTGGLRRANPPLVMRYPKSVADVATADPTQQPSSPAAPAAELDAASGTTPPAAARRRSIPLFRPPGAIAEPEFLRGCTRCNDCASACPHQAIVPAAERFREAAGTPTIHADQQACLMCEDFPCIAACDEGVLTTLIPAAMGTARVTEQSCIAHHGTTCTVCSERCPVSGAITLADGKPTIHESICTGCGVCRYVCVAPENAILLMPAFLRPAAPQR